MAIFTFTALFHRCLVYVRFTIDCCKEKSQRGFEGTNQVNVK